MKIGFERGSIENLNKNGFSTLLRLDFIRSFLDAQLYPIYNSATRVLEIHYKAISGNYIPFNAFQDRGAMSDSVFSSIRTVSDQVCDQIRVGLLSGTYSAGSRMREEELATRFGVSRHPIRKALQKLTLEGLLQYKPNCGAIVALPPNKHVEGLLTPMRKQLELYALGCAFPRLSEYRGHWDSIVLRMTRAGEDQDEQASLDCDASFHQLILICAGMEEMIPLWQSIFGRMRDYHRLSNAQQNDLRCVAFVHKILLESLFSGDLERACTNLGSHIEGTEFHQKTILAWKRVNQRQEV